MRSTETYFSRNLIKHMKTILMKFLNNGEDRIPTGHPCHPVKLPVLGLSYIQLHCRLKSIPWKFPTNPGCYQDSIDKHQHNSLNTERVSREPSLLGSSVLIQKGTLQVTKRETETPNQLPGFDLQCYPPAKHARAMAAQSLWE